MSIRQSPNHRLRRRLTGSFVGRTKELEQLTGYLDEAAKENGRFVVISGEAGSGKSALLRQMATVSANKGFTFISGSFRGTPIYEPYAPFLQILAKMGASNLQRLMELVQADIPPLQGYEESDNGHTTWNMETLYTLQSEKVLAQQYLVSSIIEISKKKPLVISLTDVHMAPLSAWQFIHYLTQSISSHKILLITTLRLDGRAMKQDKLPVYADVLQRMNREGLVTKVKLSRFSVKELRQYVRKVFRRTDFDSSLIPRIAETTGGVPEQVVAIFDVMLQKGLIFEENGVWFNWGGITRDILLKALGEQNRLSGSPELLARLNILEKRLLEYGAIFDGRFDPRLLAELMGMTPVKVIKLLRMLEEHKVLISTDGEEYEFKRPTLQALFLENISRSQWEQLHLQAARAIERSEHLGRVQKIFLLAHHYRHTPDKQAALNYLHLAGDEALSHLAFIECRDYYREVISLVEKYPELSSSGELVEMLLESAWVERILGHREQSLERCHMARELYDCNSNQRLGVQILIQEGFSYVWLSNWKKADASFQECIQRCGDTSPFDAAIANYGLGTISFELAEYDRARKYYKEALVTAERLKAVKLQANLLNNLGALENVLGHHMQAIALYSRSVPLFSQIDDRAGLARIYHNIGMTHAEGGDWEKANEFYGKSLGMTDALGILPLKSVNFLNRSLALAHLGKFEEAREYNFKAFRLVQQLKDELGLAEYYKIQGVIERNEENWEKALEYFDQAIKKYNTFHNKLGRAETEYERAVLNYRIGDRDGQQKWATRAIASYRELGLDWKIRVIRKELLLREKGEAVVQA